MGEAFANLPPIQLRLREAHMNDRLRGEHLHIVCVIVVTAMTSGYVLGERKLFFIAWGIHPNIAYPNSQLASQLFQSLLYESRDLELTLE